LCCQQGCTDAAFATTEYDHSFFHSTVVVFGIAGRSGVPD
jgi:hypothetical protein